LRRADDGALRGGELEPRELVRARLHAGARAARVLHRAVDEREQVLRDGVPPAAAGRRVRRRAGRRQAEVEPREVRAELAVGARSVERRADGARGMRGRGRAAAAAQRRLERRERG
jgi:hypothetical protein